MVSAPVTFKLLGAAKAQPLPLNAAAKASAAAAASAQIRQVPWVFFMGKSWCHGKTRGRMVV